jgi:hypothetical protein
MKALYLWNTCFALVLTLFSGLSASWTRPISHWIPNEPGIVIGSLQLRNYAAFDP